MPHVRAKVVEPTDESSSPAPLPLNTPGELIVSGYPLQKGYWCNEAETRKTMKDDEEGTTWLWTGDMCKMDEEGALRPCRAEQPLTRGCRLSQRRRKVQGHHYPGRREPLPGDHREHDRA